MSVRRIALCFVVLLSLAGCARTGRQFAATDPSISPHGTDAADNHLHPPGDEGPLPNDPIANAPPMPVAALDALKKLNEPGQGGAVAFVGPSVTKASDARADLGAASSMTQPYLLDSGDQVRVFVYGQPNLSHVYPIDAAGFIAVPLVGAVRARGLTTYRLAGAITSELKVNLIRDPQVSVEMALTRPFFILGEVRAAGRYAFEAGLTVESAVAIAGGFGARASERQVRITRRINGSVSEVRAPMTEAVRPGDTIYVEERWF